MASQFDDSELRAVKARLQDLHDAAEEIMADITAKKTPTAIRAAFKGFKMRVAEEFKAASNSRRRVPLNSAERACWLPVVQEASAKLTRVNAPLDEIYSSLYDVSSDFSHMLSQL